MHARPDKLRSHAFSHYVREYQITHAILKNAHHRGISLDDPRRLLDYLLRRKTGKPANLARLQDIVDGKSPKKTPPPPSRPINVVGKGLAKQVERLEQEVDESHAAYRRETRPFDKAQLQKIYIANLTALRQLSKTAPDADVALGKALLKSDVDMTWSRALKEFRAALEAIPRRLSTNSIFSKLDPVDLEKVVEREVGTVLEHLSNTPWLNEEKSDDQG